MIEKILLDYLSENMEEPVSFEINEKEKTFVTIEKTGTSSRNYIYSATFAIKSHAPSLYEAAVLNEKVKEVMAGIEELDVISQCELDTDYNFTDTTTKSYRYQAVYNIVHY